MNDTELDELLDIWKAPSPLESLRANVQREIAAKQGRPPRKLFTRRRVWATAAVLIFAILVVNPDAFSGKVTTYTVDSEIRYYGVPEIADVRVLITSYNDAGTEMLQSWSFPDYPAQTVFKKTRMAARRAAERLERLAWPFKKIAKYYYIWKYDLATPDATPGGVPNDVPNDARVYPNGPDMPWLIGRRVDLMSSGCRTHHGGATVIGQDTILNYSTTVLQQWDRAQKLTLWMAPELGCFALRTTMHEQQADGSWKLVSEKKALKVTLKR
jgi:hypothetical protein